MTKADIVAEIAEKTGLEKIDVQGKEQEAKDFAIEQLQEFNEDENSSYENITTSIVDCREFKEIVEF